MNLLTAWLLCSFGGCQSQRHRRLTTAVYAHTRHTSKKWENDTWWVTNLFIMPLLCSLGSPPSSISWRPWQRPCWSYLGRISRWRIVDTHVSAFVGAESGEKIWKNPTDTPLWIEFGRCLWLEALIFLNSWDFSDVEAAVGDRPCLFVVPRGARCLTCSPCFAWWNEVGLNHFGLLSCIENHVAWLLVLRCVKMLSISYFPYVFLIFAIFCIGWWIMFLVGS